MDALKLTGASSISNVALRLSEIAKLTPDKPALIVPANTKQSSYTFRELDEASSSLARGLESCGIRRGTRVALMASPSVDFFALAFALVRVGAVVVMVDPAIGLRNVTECLAECAPEVYVGTPISHLVRLAYGWGKDSVRLNITTEGDNLPLRKLWGGITLADIRSAGKSAPPFIEPDIQPDDEAAIIYTSGSTGLPKGAIYTHRNFAAQIEMLTHTFELDGGEIDLPAFPLFALIDFLVGMTAVVPDMRFPRPADVDPALMIKTISDYGVTNMFASPIVLEKLGCYAEPSKVHLRTLKRVITAGAPAQPDSLERFYKLLPADASIYGIYGATESLPITCIDSRIILAETREASAQGAGVCIGKPVSGAEVRIMAISDTPVAQWDESLRLVDGDIGEIVVAGAAVTERYVGRDALNADAKIVDTDGETLHRTGDVGYFDAQGRLWYCGRKAHRVITPDGTLFTEQVEGIFNVHPKVRRTALVSVPIMRPVLCVELEGPASADQEAIRTELLDMACQHDLTCGITTILFHPRFPVDVRHNSKILREKLAILAQKKLIR